jgi:plasmid stabilization system protein ParE
MMGINTWRKAIESGSLERLKRHPLSGAPIFDDEMRALGYRVVISGKYVSVYRLIGDTVFVCHIVHGSKDYPKLFK